MAVKEHQFDILIDIDSELALWTSYAVQGTNCKLVSWEHFNYKNDNGLKSRGFLRMLAAKTADLIVLLTERDVKEWKENININAHFSLNIFRKSDKIKRILIFHKRGVLY